MKSRHAGLQLVLLSMAAVLSGCVAHTPMSEMVMFRDPATPVRHEGSVSVGLMYSVSATYKPTEAWYKKDFPQFADRREPVGRVGTGGLYGSIVGKEGKLGVSFFLGPNPGMDATAKVFRRNYVTVGMTGYKRDFGSSGIFQAYLQHRAINRGAFAAAVGVGGRHEILMVSEGCENLMGCWYDTRVASVGVRGFALLRSPNSARTGFKLSGYVGYIPYVDQPIASVSVTAGGF